jgi:DNA adenine methylase
MIELGTHDNSPLRYPGGKARRAVRLLRFADQSKRDFVEPFAGGLGTLIRARKERLYKNFWGNDADPRVMNFWHVLRDHPTHLTKKLWIEYRRHGAGDDELFQQCKENLEDGNKISRAVSFYILNKLSAWGAVTGTMIRTQKVPIGLRPALIEKLPIFSELLEGVHLTNLDYKDVDISNNSFAFLDPPYEPNGSALYQYQVDLTEFSCWAKKLNCSWMISLNDSPSTNHLFAEFPALLEPVHYPPAINSQSRRYECQKLTEVIIMNYKRPSRDAFLRYFGWSLRKACV